MSSSNDNTIERYSPTIEEGLSSNQVAKRLSQKLNNVQDTIKTKSIGSIILQNIATLFNAINLVLALALFWAGSYKNTLFIFVVLFNLIIGTVQEVRAKLIADKLSLISAVKSTVVRNGTLTQIPINGIVLDDIVKFNTGDQVTADCIVLNGSCEVNEAFVTGEADAIQKLQGDTLLSGSYVVSGEVYAQVDKVAEYTYISKISRQAKDLKKHKSEINEAINKILKVVTIAIVPVGSLLLYSQYLVTNNIKNAIVQATAGLIGMIPEGLVLLTSMVFAVSVIRLSKQKVLAHDLYSVESLARVDVLCLDKTGTITTGDLYIDKIVPTTKEFSMDDIHYALNSIISNEPSLNATSTAIKEYLSKLTDRLPKCKVDTFVAFSSIRKWSGCSKKGIGSFIMGAYEYVFPNDDSIKSTIEHYSKDYRVVTVAYSKKSILNKRVPSDAKPIAIVLLKDTIRTNAKQTIDYFKSQDVDVKIISGDSLKTVCNVANAVGLESSNALDTSTVSKKELSKLVEDYSIFCRVTPENKRVIVKALQDRQHIVAMTGDGVNDVPALKEADCSIALSNGAEATRNVSQLILLNSDFSALPKVVAEGRRSINNIKRSASLFLVKTVYTALLDVIFILLTLEYPFEPIQLTLFSATCIGIPSFILALEPNSKRVTSSFLKSVLYKAVPTALSIVLNVTIVSILSNSILSGSIPKDEVSTICLIVTEFIGMLHLIRLCKPFNIIRTILLIVLISIFLVGVLALPQLFSIVSVSTNGLILIVCMLIASTITHGIFHQIFTKKS